MIILTPAHSGQGSKKYIYLGVKLAEVTFNYYHGAQIDYVPFRVPRQKYLKIFYWVIVYKILGVKIMSIKRQSRQLHNYSRRLK